MLTRELIDEVARLVTQDLHEQFKDDFVFDPIIAERAVDHYGDEYIDIFVIFDGDQKNLHPGKVAGVWSRLDPQMEALDIASIPSLSFVEKSEWAEVYHGHYPRRDELW